MSYEASDQVCPMSLLTMLFAAQSSGMTGKVRKENAKLLNVITVVVAKKWPSYEAQQGEGRRLFCFFLNAMMKDTKIQRQAQFREMKANWSKE